MKVLGFQFLHASFSEIFTVFLSPFFPLILEFPLFLQNDFILRRYYDMGLSRLLDALLLRYFPLYKRPLFAFLLRKKDLLAMGGLSYYG